MAPQKIDDITVIISFANQPFAGRMCILLCLNTVHNIYIYNEKAPKYQMLNTLITVPIKIHLLNLFEGNIPRNEQWKKGVLIGIINLIIW